MSNRSIVEHCTAISNGGNGYFVDDSSAVNCVASLNQAYGFNVAGTTISSCSASENGFDGFIVGAGSVDNCTATLNEGSGFRCFPGSVLRGCSADSNIGAGIRVSGDCLVSGCNASQNSGPGIMATAAGDSNRGSRIEFNGANSNDVGISATDPAGGSHFIVGNTASGNMTTNFDVHFIHRLGTVQTGPVNAGPWDNFSF
jgi:hypothetical protein